MRLEKILLGLAGLEPRPLAKKGSSQSNMPRPLKLNLRKKNEGLKIESRWVFFFCQSRTTTLNYWTNIVSLFNSILLTHIQRWREKEKNIKVLPFFVSEVDFLGFLQSSFFRNRSYKFFGIIYINYINSVIIERFLKNLLINNPLTNQPLWHRRSRLKSD